MRARGGASETTRQMDSELICIAMANESLLSCPSDKAFAGCFTLISICYLSTSYNGHKILRRLRVQYLTLTGLLSLKIKMIHKVALAGVSIRTS